MKNRPWLDFNRKRVNDSSARHLAAILIIGLVAVVLAVVMRKKDKVDASAGGSVDCRMGLGLLQRP